MEYLPNCNELKIKITELENEKENLEKRVKELTAELKTWEESSYDTSELNTIDAGIGKIEWMADNLQLVQIMEELAEKLAPTAKNNILRLPT